MPSRPSSSPRHRGQSIVYDELSRRDNVAAEGTTFGLLPARADVVAFFVVPNRRVASSTHLYQAEVSERVRERVTGWMRLWAMDVDKVKSVSLSSMPLSSSMQWAVVCSKPQEEKEVSQ